VAVVQRTLTIIKPDAVEAGAVGAIIARLQEEGFRVVALRQRHLARREAEGFYHVHRERPFFGELTAFMSSGPCIPIVLERENAIAHLRQVMGATDPAKADPGTIRKRFGRNVGENAIHGSDAPETAREEIAYFFAGIELLGGGPAKP
jgi:nucleoside-diphosphate kinase